MANAAFERVSAGEDFAAVAKICSAGRRPTPAGLVSRRDLRHPCREVFATAAGEFTGPVESAFGIHVLAIDKIIAGGEADLADIRDAIRQTLQSESAIDLIFEKANVLEDLVRPAPQLMKRSARLAARR